MPAKIIRHPSGFVEIDTKEGMLLLITEEYEAAARRRGESVERNRRRAVKEAIHEDH
jgi:hypothetical protein